MHVSVFWYQVLEDLYEATQGSVTWENVDG